MYFSFTSSQLAFKPMSQISHMLLIPQLIKRCFFTFLQIFPSSFECLCWNTCFQKINYQVPGCHRNRTGYTEVLTKYFGMQNVGNTHVQWRKGSVSLCPVNSFSLLNTNYTSQNNTLLILLVKKTLGSVNVSSKIKLMMMQCKILNLSPLFSNICLLLVWEDDTEKWLFLFLKMQMPLALEEHLSQPYVYHHAEEFLFYPQMHFTRAGVQCSVGVNFFFLPPILFSTEHTLTHKTTGSKSAALMW